MSWQKNSVMSKELERRLSLVYNEPSNVNHKLERLRRVGGGVGEGNSDPKSSIEKRIQRCIFNEKRTSELIYKIKSKSRLLVIKTHTDIICSARNSGQSCFWKG